MLSTKVVPLPSKSNIIRRPRVLLADYSNFESYCELPALISKAGCEVDIYCDRRSWLKRNKYWQEWIVCDKDEDKFFEGLKEIAESDVYDWIILGDDPALSMVNERVTDPLLFNKLLPLTKIENRAILGSKSGFSKICENYGIKTPAYLLYTNVEKDRSVLSDLRFPVMLKADKSVGGEGVFYCADETALTDNLNKVSDKSGLVIQEYIHGDLIGVEVLYKNGELLAYCYGEMVKTLYNELSVSTERHFRACKEIEDELIKIGRTIGINGFGNFTFIYSKQEDAHYFIEADLRPQAWMYYGQFCGVDFSLAVRSYLNNDMKLISATGKYAKKTQVVAHYRRDMMRCILNADLKGILKWVFNINGRWRYIPFYDRKQLYYTHVALGQFVKNIFKHRVRVLKGTAIPHKNRIIAPGVQA